MAVELDALRATIGVMPRAGVPVRDVVALRTVDWFSAVRAAVARDWFGVARVVVAVRGISVVPRCVFVRFATVDVRICEDVFLSDALRATDVPSRTAALATPMQTSRFVIKNRILFISDGKFSKFAIFSASE